MKNRAILNYGSFQSIKTVYIENLGCAKNQVDAEVMLEALRRAGYAYSQEAEKADLILVNSCGFIEEAKKESVETSLDLKRRYPDKKVVLTGCLSQRYPNELFDGMGEIDGIAGNGAPHRIDEMIRRIESGERVRWLPAGEFGAWERGRFFSSPNSAYVKVAEGCDNRCSFCAIPTIRGPRRSRNHRDILEEVSGLIRRGIFEINLIAQDLGSFGYDTKGPKLPELLEKITEIPGKFWIRMLYIHPDNFPEELLSLCRKDSRLLPYFDLPFQHASAPLLRKMNRRGSSDEYLALIRRIRSSLPNAVIRSTFLLGFPGERPRDIAILESFQEQAQFDWLGVFLYSREEGTPAFRFRGPLRHALAHRRAGKEKQIIEQRQQGIMEQRLERFVDTDMDVLIEERVVGEDLALGRSYAQAPEVDGLIVVRDHLVEPGQVVPCTIIGRNGIDLVAQPAGSPVDCKEVTV